MNHFVKKKISLTNIKKNWHPDTKDKIPTFDMLCLNYHQIEKNYTLIRCLSQTNKKIHTRNTKCVTRALVMKTCNQHKNLDINLMLMLPAKKYWIDNKKVPASRQYRVDFTILKTRLNINWPTLTTLELNIVAKIVSTWLHHPKY